MRVFLQIILIYGIDVLGPAKGWAASLLCRQSTRDQLTTFRKRHDTFSLGVCNGCQLMALFGWLDPVLPASTKAPVIVLERNRSARYESRFVTVDIGATNAVLLQGMIGSRIGVWVANEEGTTLPFLLHYPIKLIAIFAFRQVCRR